MRYHLGAKGSGRAAATTSLMCIALRRFLASQSYFRISSSVRLPYATPR